VSDVLRLPVAHEGDSVAPSTPAPAHLSERTQALWADVVGDWELEAHQLRILEEALVALDRSEQARELIAEDGPVVKDRFDQLKAHPAVAIERDARIAAARMFRELNLDLDSAEGSRPPRIGRKS
jgi:phage terminase small subunit